MGGGGGWEWGGGGGWRKVRQTFAIGRAPRGCQNDEPSARDVAPSTLSAPFQSRTKFRNRPSACCVQRQKPSRPSTQVRATGEPVRSHRSHHSTRARDASSRQATPSSPVSRAPKCQPFSSA